MPRERFDLDALRRHPLDGQSAGSAQLRLRVPRHQGRRAAGQHQRRHRHRELFRPRRPDRTGVSRRVADARPGDGRGRLGRRGPAGARRAGRAGVHGAVSQHAGGLLERSGSAAVSGGVLRALPGGVASRGLGGAHAARRADHPRAQRRHAQSGRRAHRHGGDLPAGRAVRGGAGVAGDRAALARERRRLARGAVRSAAPGGRPGRGVARRNPPAHSRTRQPASRAAASSWRWPTCRAPSAARSPRSPFATWSTGGWCATWMLSPTRPPSTASGTFRTSPGTDQRW